MLNSYTGLHMSAKVIEIYVAFEIGLRETLIEHHQIRE